MKTHLAHTAHARPAARPGYSESGCPASTPNCRPVLPRTLVGAAFCPACGLKGDTRDEPTKPADAR